VLITLKKQGAFTHGLQESKFNFFQTFKRLSAHVHLKKIKIIGFKSGLGWKKYANNMPQTSWVWRFCCPNILLSVALEVTNIDLV